MIRARRFVNRAKHAPKISDGFTALDIGNLLKKEINRDCMIYAKITLKKLQEVLNEF